MARTLREIALAATGNIGEDRVNAGELAVLEDVARNPGATIGEITGRTGLAQSLVSRIVRSMAEEGAITAAVDGRDRRKTRVALEAGTREQIIQRAGTSIATALAAHTPQLTVGERDALEDHLAQAARLLGASTTGSVRQA